MRTIADIAELCLAYVEVDAGTASLVTEATGVQQRFLCSTITGALQELHALKPEAFRIRSGAILTAPESIAATVTAGSTAVSLPGGGRDFRGLSVRDASGGYNQIAPATATPGAAFVKPWDGATGATSLTVFGDAILISTGAFTVMGDVHLDGYGPLIPAPDRATYTAYRDDLSQDNYGSRPPSLSRPRRAGQPEAWWSEATFQAGVRQQLYLRFAPVPDRVYTVSYDLALTPREIVVGDLIDTTTILPMPGDFIDAILVPYVLQRWTGSPWFRNEVAKAELGRQYKTAKAMLEDWGAQVQQNRQFIVVGD